MKVTLEFTKFSERYPEDKNRDVLIAYRHEGSVGAASMSAGNHYEVHNEHLLWWSYFDFQPERLSEETQKWDAIV